MANKKYKMTVSLSDGSTVDAGTFVAPQGPKGDTGAQGPAGTLGEWISTTATNFTAEYNSMYLIYLNSTSSAGLLVTTDRFNASVGCFSQNRTGASSGFTTLFCNYDGKFSSAVGVTVNRDKTINYTEYDLSSMNIKYIKVK